MPLKGEKPKPGDLIEIDRGLYKHWGVYVGNDYIVHLADVNGITTPTSLPSANGMAEVRKDRLQDVARNCNYWVNNKYDKRQTPYPVKEIIKRAIKRVGEKRRYEVFSQNCEHFVTEVRYNKAMCDQVTKAAGGAVLFTFVTAVVAGAFNVLRH